MVLACPFLLARLFLLQLSLEVRFYTLHMFNHCHLRTNCTFCLARDVFQVYFAFQVLLHLVHGAIQVFPDEYFFRCEPRAYLGWLEGLTSLDSRWAEGLPLQELVLSYNMYQLLEYQM